jgi:hypothetical protein
MQIIKINYGSYGKKKAQCVANNQAKKSGREK